MKYVVVTLDVYVPVETMRGMDPRLMREVTWRGMELGNLTKGSCVVIDSVGTLTCWDSAGCRCAVCRDQEKNVA